MSLTLIFCVSIANAAQIETLTVEGEDFALQHYPSSGNQLILYVSSGYGFNERSSSTAKRFTQLGIEVWMVDLAENLFLPVGNESMHSIDGRYVAGLIQQVHQKTGKNVTLLTSSFGSIPVLLGARQWQIDNKNLNKPYLTGAILFSPELYKSIPPLGVDPEFEEIASATNIPIMIYQAALRNNRWQLTNVVEKLEKNEAVVYQKILPGIVSFFYKSDELPKTLQTLNELPNEIPRVITLLEKTPTPLKPAKLSQNGKRIAKKLDIKLVPYKGKSKPIPFDLMNIDGKRIVRTNFKGKVTIVNFWATWCPPCVEEIPMLNRLKNEMSGDRFELLSINFGQDKSLIQEFLKEVKVEFPVLLDEEGKIAGQWNTIVLPSTFVIGPDGEFAYAVNAAIEWDSPDVIKMMKKLALIQR